MSEHVMKMNQQKKEQKTERKKKEERDSIDRYIYVLIPVATLLS